MTRVVYVNGRYLPYARARIHAEDRGFQFADSIYEVCEVNQGHLIEQTRHLARLERSLAELKIPQPMSNRALAHVLHETVRRNRINDGLVYLQVSRGSARRDFPFPRPSISPTVVCLARSISRANIELRAARGIGVKTMPDIRWGRADIKTVMLLPACLAKEAAREEDADEAWFVDAEGFVTEGASSNAWIVDGGGTVVTRPLGRDILAGITRATLLDLIAEEGIAVVERPFRVAEARAAKEAFVTSASATVMPVIKIDGHPIGNGTPGPLVQSFRSRFHQIAESSRVELFNSTCFRTDSMLANSSL
jgi:D-alanine transaminase